MNITGKTVALVALLGLGLAFSSLGNEAAAKDRPRGHHGPPPEAYTACEGLSVGDVAELETPHGDILTGTCEEEGDRLVLRPDNLPEGAPPEGPPPDEEWQPGEDE
jgi:hypothetical protein